MAINNTTPTIHFEKVTQKRQKCIFDWLEEPHMQEFWDNSQEHKDDIINFIKGRPDPSNYFNGIFSYWVGIIDNDPFCLILTAVVNRDDSHPQIWLDHISNTGKTYGIDFGIGNTTYLGKKLAAPTLKLFMEFFRKNIAHDADTFFIDPDVSNLRAMHVYEKAGFERVGDYKMKEGVFKGEQTLLMVKQF